jgi:hypothetical protein
MAVAATVVTAVSLLAKLRVLQGTAEQSVDWVAWQAPQSALLLLGPALQSAQLPGIWLAPLSELRSADNEVQVRRRSNSPSPFSKEKRTMKSIVSAGLAGGLICFAFSFTVLELGLVSAKKLPIAIAFVGISIFFILVLINKWRK